MLDSLGARARAWTRYAAGNDVTKIDKILRTRVPPSK